jgi:hypothetical protein
MENGDRIKNSNQKEENHRFSTLKFFAFIYTKEVLCLFHTIPLVFYSVTPKGGSPRANGFGGEIVVLRPRGVYKYVGGRKRR